MKEKTLQLYYSQEQEKVVGKYIGIEEYSKEELQIQLEIMLAPFSSIQKKLMEKSCYLEIQYNHKKKHYESFLWNIEKEKSFLILGVTAANIHSCINELDRKLLGKNTQEVKKITEKKRR